MPSLSHVPGRTSAAIRPRRAREVGSRCLYDGDLPLSLPELLGEWTPAFNYTQRRRPSEYDLVVSNSGGWARLGGMPRLARARASGPRAVFMGRRPEESSRPQPVATGMMDACYLRPTADKSAARGRQQSGSRAGEAPDIDYTGGRAFHPGRRRSSPQHYGDVPLSTPDSAARFGRRGSNIQRARRHSPPLPLPHLPHRSSYRLDRAGDVYTNPPRAIEQWFTKGSELVVVNDASESPRRRSGSARSTLP